MNTWLNINLSNISYNIKGIKELIGKDREILAVVKSNAYGHGLIAVSKAAVRAGAKMLGVININEALQLRKAGIKAPILVLSAVEKKCIREAIKNKIDITVFDKHSANNIISGGVNTAGSLNIHLKIDSGMGRLGLMPDEALSVAKALNKNTGINPKINHRIKIRGVMTHFCCADLEKRDLIKKQAQIFKKVLDNLWKNGIKPEIIHSENSAAALRHTDLHGPLDYARDKLFTDKYGQIFVRPGIAIYGLSPFGDNRDVNLKPALEWKAKVVQVKNLPKGHCVSYGCAFKTKRPTKIAVLPVGYYEGYDRKLSNRGEVLIHGKRVSVIGRVTMNYIMINVTNISRVKVGDEAVLIGKQGKEEITVDELAKKMGTINYEVLTRINPAVRRLYK